MAQFSLSPGAVSKEVVHRTVEEVWCFIADRGRMWRQLEGCDEIVEVGPGASVSIPVGTRFQFRCDGAEKLVAVGTTMPRNCFCRATEIAIDKAPRAGRVRPSSESSPTTAYS